MGISKIGFSLLEKTAAFAKASGKTSILQTKATIFHGINPTVTYPLTGKTAELPRFISEEMKVARKLNKIATRQCKTPPDRAFAKATPEDFKRLTSDTLEDSYSRVQWTNPKDGKVYNLLKQGETKDGNIVIRILDKDGAFIKEAEIKPKEIAIIDDRYGLALNTPFGWNEENLPAELVYLSHGSAVEIFAKRSNPFARYTIFDSSFSTFGGVDIDKVANHLKNLQQGKKYDYVNCSFGFDIQDPAKPCESAIKNACIKIDKLYSTRGTRVLISGGNSGEWIGPKAYNAYLVNSKSAEGVGSLNNRGMISSFSSSRNSKYCQHYEQGEFPITQTSQGFNITGQPGTDIVGEGKNPYVGMRLGDFRKLEEVDSKYANRIGFPRGGECSEDEVATLLFPKDWMISGTSYSAPIRTAKLALNDMLEGLF